MAIFKKGDNWYIDYYVAGRRKREKIGPNKRLAENVLAKRKTEIAENKFLDIRREEKITFEVMAEEYLEYAKVNKRSWDRDAISLKFLSGSFKGKYLFEITPQLIEKHKLRQTKACM